MALTRRTADNPWGFTEGQLNPPEGFTPFESANTIGQQYPGSGFMEAPVEYKAQHPEWGNDDGASYRFDTGFGMLGSFFGPHVRQALETPLQHREAQTFSGDGFSGSVSIDWALGEKIATLGTPQFFRALYANSLPTDPVGTEIARQVTMRTEAGRAQYVADQNWTPVTTVGGRKSMNAGVQRPAETVGIYAKAIGLGAGTRYEARSKAEKDIMFGGWDVGGHERGKFEKAQSAQRGADIANTNRWWDGVNVSASTHKGGSMTYRNPTQAASSAINGGYQTSVRSTSGPPNTMNVSAYAHPDAKVDGQVIGDLRPNERYLMDGTGSFNSSWNVSQGTQASTISFARNEPDLRRFW